jgi:hypothetical protein
LFAGCRPDSTGVRHRTGLNAGKIGASAITTACQPHNPDVKSVGVHQLESDDQQLAAAEDLGGKLREVFDARDTAAV